MTEPASRTLEEWSALLGGLWEQRARLPSRDLFVSSHPGWNDPTTWRQVAETELALYLSGLDDEWLAGADVLEIGCGSGRLAELLIPRVRSYTGFDIAPAMVAAARERCGDSGRFLTGDGVGVPEPARDRRYRLVLAAAVFIHCPRKVIGALIESAWQVLTPDGQLRFQVRGDPDDPTGIQSPNAESSTETLRRQRDRVRLELGEEEKRLTRGSYYMGARFGYDDLRRFVVGRTGGEVQLYRGNVAAIYGMVKPGDA